MAIVLDQIIVSDPVIQAKISGGNAQITLGSSQDRSVVEKDARELALTKIRCTTCSDRDS